MRFPPVKVGDELLYVERNKTRDVRVTKVGRKYFSVTDGHSWWLEKSQFHLDSGYVKSDYSSAGRCVTEELMAEEVMRERLTRALSVEFGVYGLTQAISAQTLQVVLDALRADAAARAAIKREDQQ